MKKLILLFSVISLALTSCNSDDDSSSSQDQIIGTWKFHKFFTNGVEETLTDCEKQETYTFRSNGTVDYMYYEQDLSSNCILEEDVTGTWENDGNNNYAVDFGDGPSTQAVFFQNNTFYFEDVFEGDTYRQVYIRD
jgi:hypothetical protein